MPPGATECTLGKAEGVCPTFHGCTLCIGLEEGAFCAEECTLGEPCSGGRVFKKIGAPLSYAGHCRAGTERAGYCADAAPPAQP